MMIYMGNAEEFLRRLLEPFSVFIKVTGHMTETQKATKLLYTNNEHVEVENKSTVTLTTALKKMKYFKYKLNKTGTGSVC